MTSGKLFELIGAAEDELLEQSDWRIQKKKPGFKIKAALAIAAAIAALLAVIGTAAAVRGVDPVSLIADAFSKRGKGWRRLMTGTTILSITEDI